VDARRFNCRKKEYVPGESGELAARSDFAGRTGLQKKSILVVTKDTINQPVILRLLVTIPEAVSVEPEVVFGGRVQNGLSCGKPGDLLRLGAGAVTGRAALAVFPCCFCHTAVLS